MKNLIMFSALLVLMLLFPTQYSLNQLNHTRMLQFENIVMNEGVYRARREGCFKPDNIENLKTKISSLYGIDKSEIVVNVTTIPKYRRDVFDERELISYEISVPLKQLIVGASLFGISNADNQGMYTVQGTVESEVLAP